MHVFAAIWAIGVATMKGGLRDRLVQGLLLAGLLFLLSTVVFSSFSMRQAVEVAINYSLSAANILAVLITLFLGLHLLSSEIENRAGYGVLTQPVSRSSYVLGKFLGLVLLGCIVVVFLAVCVLIGILMVRAANPGATPVHWTNIGLALAGTLLISLLLSAVSLLCCTVATSSLLPFLATIAVWVIGNSMQTVKNYLDSGINGQHMTPQLKAIIHGAYYVFPNLNLLDFKVYAIYGLPLPGAQIVFALAYGLLYIGVLLALSTWLFQTRDMV